MKKKLLPSRKSSFYVSFMYKKLSVYTSYCDNKNKMMLLDGDYLCLMFIHCIFLVDPRTKDWFLMSNPLPTALICATYVFTVKIAGPRIMANRKPMELRNVLIAYNLFQVIFSSWLFYEVSVVIIVI